MVVTRKPYVDFVTSLAQWPARWTLSLPFSEVAHVACSGSVKGTEVGVNEDDDGSIVKTCAARAG